MLVLTQITNGMRCEMPRCNNGARNGKRVFSANQEGAPRQFAVHICEDCLKDIAKQAPKVLKPKKEDEEAPKGDE